MATSTFGKQFTVKPEKANEFVREMTKAVTPTLRKDFHSNLAHLTQEKTLKDSLSNALNR